MLKDYRLDSAHIQGFVAAISKTDIAIETVSLDNCDIKDADLASLLHSLARHNKLNIFIYKNSSFLDQSLAAIKPILIKPDSRHSLLDLRLVRCATEPRIVQGLIEFMV